MLRGQRLWAQLLSLACVQGWVCASTVEWENNFHHIVFYKVSLAKTWTGLEKKYTSISWDFLVYFGTTKAEKKNSDKVKWAVFQEKLLQ